MNKKEIKIIEALIKGLSRAELEELFLGSIKRLGDEICELHSSLAAANDKAKKYEKLCKQLKEDTHILEELLIELLNIGESVLKDTDKVTAHKNSKAVRVCNKQTGLSKEFSSLTEASKELSVALGGLSDVANGKREMIKGYTVKFI